MPLLKTWAAFAIGGGEKAASLACAPTGNRRRRHKRGSTSPGLSEMMPKKVGDGHAGDCGGGRGGLTRSRSDEANHRRDDE